MLTFLCRIYQIIYSHAYFENFRGGRAPSTPPLNPPVIYTPKIYKLPLEILTSTPMTRFDSRQGISLTEYMRWVF